MRQQHGTSRHIPPGVTTFPTVTADTNTATPRHTYPPPSQRLGPLRRHRPPPHSGHCPASPPGSNAPTPRRNAPAPFKTLLAAAQRSHRPDASDHPTDTGPRTAPGTASPLRRAPTLKLPVVTLSLHSSHSSAATHRFHRPDASNHPADTGPPHARHCPASPPGPNAPTPRRNSPTPFKTLPYSHTPVPHCPGTSKPSACTRLRLAAGHKKIRLCEPDLFICQ